MSDNVFKLPERHRAAVLTVLLPSPLPDGPFTVTIADAKGKMFEVVFPDGSGTLPPDAGVMGTQGEGMPQLVVNLMTSFIRIFAGRPS